MALRRATRVTWTIARGLILLLVFGFVTLYLMASWQPGAYRPMELTQLEKEGYAKRFVSRVTEFTNVGQMGQPFTWTIREEDLNGYLVSIDQIVALQPGRRHGEFQKVLDTAGLTEPIVQLADGWMTVMLRSNEYGKVLSAGIRIQMTDDGRLRVTLEDSRVGLLPIPRFEVRRRLREFQGSLQERLARLQRAAESDEGMVSIAFGRVDFLLVLESLALAVDDQPLPTRFEISGDHFVRIEDIVVTPDSVTLHLVPAPEEDLVGPPAPSPESDQTPAIDVATDAG